MTGSRDAKDGGIDAEGSDVPLTERAGFLIRRVHQLHLAMFYEVCARIDVTPVQSSILTVLSDSAPLDQATIASAIGVDRATVGLVLRRLEERGLVDRAGSSDDKRMKLARLTEEGRGLLKRIAPLTAKAHARTLAALTARERRQFLACLRKLVSAENDRGRAPLRWGSDA